jgi:methyl-accepting chemotaxis protein
MEGNGKSTDLLDRAMRDLTAEQRARTLDMVLRLGIDRDDPLFLITLAIGQLKTLIEDAPQEWKSTLTLFTSFLEEWSKNNLKMFESAARQAEATESISEVSKELITALSALTRLLTEQSQTPQSYGRNLESLSNKFEDLQNALTHRLNAITESLETQRSARSMSSTLTASSGNGILTGTWNAKWLLAGLLVVLFGGLTELWQGQQRNAQTLQWLLIKATRQECVSGAVDKKAPQCRQFLK